MSRTVPLPLTGGEPEFPGYVNVLPGSGEAEVEGFDRRRFVQLAAVSAAAAGVGVTGCRRPVYEIRPFTRPPENNVPGLPVFYATTLLSTPTPAPVLVEDNEGRPTKIEGNPLHPASLGSTDAFAQASVLDLYHPDRARSLRRNGEIVGWDRWEAADLPGHIARLPEGKGLAFLCEAMPSPAMRMLRAHLATARPAATWHEYQPVDDSTTRAGTALAFGEALVPTYHYDAARRIVSLDADFLGRDGDTISHRRFARSRHSDHGEAMNRLYVAETTFTVTGGMADHRLRLPSAYIADLALALAGALARKGATYDPALARAARAASPGQAGVHQAWIDAVATDLAAHRGAALIVAGRNQPPLVHALAHAMTAALDGVGKTISYVKLPEQPPAQSLGDLVKALDAGEVDTLVLLGGNPTYTAPADQPLGREQLAKVKSHIVRLSLQADETSQAATEAAQGSRVAWHLPATHDLEQWGDAETADGTYSPVQPLIEPLVDRALSPWELVARLTRHTSTQGYEIARASFRLRAGTDDDAAFRTWLHEGVLAKSARPAVTPKIASDALTRAISAAAPAKEVSATNVELSFYPCSRLHDGRYAANAWLQELPDPVSKLTWDNAALISPATARTLIRGAELKTGDRVRLKLGERSIETAVAVLPGQADHCVSVTLGSGRRYAGRVGSVLHRDAEGRLDTGADHGGGFDVYPLRTSDRPSFTSGLTVERLYGTYPLAFTQMSFTQQHGREIVKSEPIQKLKPKVTDHTHGHAHAPADLSEIVPLDPHQGWGMVIDLANCTGCSACMIACQSENNVPVVGKGEVIRGREMHWIRLDRYFLTEAETGHSTTEPGLVSQPVACVHCERAPCELVCPVNAAVHSPEGLNLQVYNRCIGTRYCSNNCPYKARRFNWFDYNQRPLDALRLGPLTEKGVPELLKMRNNPDVTVRMRGVMEKCTYCVQRIERAKAGRKLEALREGSQDFRVPDGMVTPACAQACPSQAIVFGNVNDPESRVAKLREESPRNYGLLDHELNVRPRTTYLTRITNPNPALQTGTDKEAEA